MRPHIALIEHLGSSLKGDPQLNLVIYTQDLLVGRLIQTSWYVPKAIDGEPRTNLISYPQDLLVESFI